MNEYYLLFAGSDYYPSGGMMDLIDKFDTLDEAKQAVNPDNIGDHDPMVNSAFDWAHVARVDSNGVSIVAEIAQGQKDFTVPGLNRHEIVIGHRDDGTDIVTSWLGGDIPGKFKKVTFSYWRDIPSDEAPEE